MGTNFYRIPSEEEMQDRKDRLWFRIVDLNMTPEFIERNFRYLGEENSWENPWEEFTDRTNIHLGKRSSGWKFCWNFNSAKWYSTKEELLEFVRSGRVVDEYGDEQNVEEFITMALEWDGVIFNAEYEKKLRFETPGYLPRGPKDYDKVIDGLRVSSSSDFC